MFPRQSGNLFVASMPGLFVFFWSTGFIGAKFGLPHAEPFTFVFYRLLAACALLWVSALFLPARFPKRLVHVGHISVSGILIHALYVGVMFAAMDQGMPSGVAALIVGLQPVLTALIARGLLGERISWVQWCGFVLGLAGVAMVLGAKFIDSTGPASADYYGGGATLLAIVALVSISLGTVYQKRFCANMDLLGGIIIQSMAAAGVVGILAGVFESMTVVWNAEFILAFSWLVLVNSIASISLLMVLIKRGPTFRVAGLFYLAPPATALQGYFLFGERLGEVALMGMAIAAFGVALVVRRPQPS